MLLRHERVHIWNLIHNYARLTSPTIYLPDRLMVNKDIDLYQYEPMRVNSNIVQV